MPESKDSVDRRDFLKKASAAGLSFGLAKSSFAGHAARSVQSNRVLGANDRINIGIIGAGGRGTDDGRSFQRYGENTNACQIVAVCDVYEKRKKQSAEQFKSDGYM